jgi:hypothetical protein
MLREEIVMIGERIAQEAAHVDASTHRLLTDIRLFDAQSGWCVAGARSCAAWLAWRLGWTMRTARERLRVARALGVWPEIDEALRRGLITYSKARVITRVTTAANVTSLIECACSMTATELEQTCTDLHRARWLVTADPSMLAQRRRMTKRRLESGMVKIVAVLPEDEASLVWAATEAASGDRADGLVALASDAVFEGRPRSPGQVIVDASADARVGQPDDRGMTRDGPDESAAPSPGTVPDSSGVRGPVRQVVSAVRARSPWWQGPVDPDFSGRSRSCHFPGCTSNAVAEGHRLEPRAGTAKPTLDDLVLLCRYHHRFIHDHGIRVSLDDRKRLVFRDRDGRRIERVPPRPPPEGPVWPATEKADVPIDSIQRCRRASAAGARSEGVARQDATNRRVDSLEVIQP